MPRWLSRRRAVPRRLSRHRAQRGVASKPIRHHTSPSNSTPVEPTPSEARRRVETPPATPHPASSTSRTARFRRGGSLRSLPAQPARPRGFDAVARWLATGSTSRDARFRRGGSLRSLPAQPAGREVSTRWLAALATGSTCRERGFDAVARSARYRLNHQYRNHPHRNDFRITTRGNPSSTEVVSAAHSNPAFSNNPRVPT